MSIAAAPLKREARKAETRRALIEAASELFANQGIDATSIDEVATAVGLTKGAVYAHFPNKAELVEQVLDAASATVEGDLLVDPTKSLAERITQVGAEAAELLPKISRRSLMLHMEYLLFVMRDPDRERAAVREKRRARKESGTWFEDAARQRGDQMLMRGDDLAGILEAVGKGLALELAIDPKAFSRDGVERFFAALGHGLDHIEPVNALLSSRSST